MIRVLVVDDERGVTDLITSFLRDRDFAVDGVYGGIEALGVMREKKADIIFLDLLMKGVGGLETLTKIKEISAKAKVVIVSATDDRVVIERVIALGADAFIPKPFSLGDINKVLTEKIQEVLSERHI
ncbi:MAG: response regulator [Candidatus Omnitrophica bacterium]|nr:response regulator [Candidatus Omnitrophota bacterium]